MSNDKLMLDLVALSDNDEPVKTVLVTPDGHVKSSQGDFVMDTEAGALTVKAFDDHGTDLPIDYEHQTLGGKYASPSGKAPAAGWIKRVWYEAGRGLLAAVEWTARAAEMIRAKEYKYLSPVISVRKTDRKCAVLHSAALTNVPAIRRMEALAAKQQHEKEKIAMADEPITAGIDPMKYLQRIAEVMGLEEVEDDAALYQAILAKARELMKGGGGGDEGEATGDIQVASSVRQQLGLSPDADAETVKLAMKEGHKVEGELVAMRTELAAMKEKAAERDVDDLLRPFVAKGAIDEKKDPDDYQLFARMAREHPDDCRHLLERRMKLLPPQGQTEAPPETERATVIASAREEFAVNPDGAVCSLVQYVEGALGEEKLAGLSDDEKQTLVA